VKNIRSAILRLGHAWPWIIAQFAGMIVLILLGLTWTRIPDKTTWEVLVTLAMPLLLIVAVLLLQTATMRRLMDYEHARIRLVWSVLFLGFWVALGLIACLLLDWCDARIPNWASYLNSRFSAHSRATVFTYEHLQRWLSLAEWVFRWILVPGKLTLNAMATVQWGWRAPFRRVLRLIFSWRWWLAVVICSLIAVAWPSTFFEGVPHGTVSHQVWAVTLKLAAVYFLAIAAWLILLAWAATLFSAAKPAADPGERIPVPAPTSPPDGNNGGAVRLPLPEGGGDSIGNA